MKFYNKYNSMSQYLDDLLTVVSNCFEHVFDKFIQMNCHSKSKHFLYRNTVSGIKSSKYSDLKHWNSFIYCLTP